MNIDFFLNFFIKTQKITEDILSEIINSLLEEEEELKDVLMTEF